MASSMETNVSIGRWARVGKIPVVKQRDFESRRHPSSKGGKERKKRQETSGDEGAVERTSGNQGRDTIEKNRKKRGPAASGSQLDVIV